MTTDGAAKFRDVAPELWPFVPRSLLDGPGWARLLDRVGGMPDWVAAAGVGFEFRLTGDAEADFALAVSPDSPLLAYYLARGREARPGSAAMALGRFFAQATGSETTSGRPTFDWFEAAMLEYDVAGAEPGQAADPGLFIRLVHGGPGRPGRRLPPPRDLVATLAGGVGWDEDEDEARAVEHVFAALPPAGRVGQIGAIPGRARRVIRMIVDGVEAEAVPACLGQLGWPGQAGKAVAVLDEMGDVAPQFRLSLDVSVDGLSPRLGLELYPPGKRGDLDHWLTTGRSDWRPIVERVAALGWSLPDKARGLLDFPGLDRLFGERGVLVLYRGINHLKITIEADSVTAKGYAGLRYFPVETASGQ